MAFTAQNLSVLAYGFTLRHYKSYGFTLWHYKSKDKLEDIQKDNYFSDASDMLQVGDNIHISAGDGATLIWVKISSIEKVQTAKLA
jgi:hypothetical protein